MKLQIHKLCIALAMAVGAIQFTNAQIKAVNYELKYNKNTSLYDCYLVVQKGNATTMKDRVQFNAQISILVPTGGALEMTESYMPLEDNQQYTGIKPIIWKVEKPLIGPKAAPKYDFYSISPMLFPSAFYNDLKEGDKVKLFSVKIDTNDTNGVRLYNKAIDPDSGALGMKGRDFNNSFSLGGPDEDYVGR